MIACSSPLIKLFVGVMYLGYRVPPVTTQTNLDTVSFPPAAKGWGTKYTILNLVPPLMAEEEGSPT
jgi:hypothetical protein